MISYTVNTETFHTPSITVEELVMERTGSTTGVAVAISGAVIPRSQWSRSVQEGDQVEILTAVQGG